MRQASHRCMAEHLASCQMLYLDSELRVAPLHIGVPRTPESSPRCAETFDLSEKLSAFLSGKRDEGRPP